MGSQNSSVQMECALEEQHSQEQCIKGQTFNCQPMPCGNRALVWTAHGCRGKFKCNGNDVVCDSLLPFNECPCQNFVASSPSAFVYGRNLTDGSVAVALYNPADTAATGEFDFTML